MTINSIFSNIPSNKIPPIPDSDSIKPLTPEELFLKGVYFTAEMKYFEAEQFFRQVLAIAPNSQEALLNLGYVLDAQGLDKEALCCYESVLTSFPNCAEARYNRATHLLRNGDYLNGFADYEYRLSAMKDIDVRNYSQPLWGGEPLNGRTVLVYCEQGLGDAIMFARYVSLITERGGRVVLEAQPPLVPILESLPGVERVIEKSSRPPITDCHIRLLSLPSIFHSLVEAIPNQIPYLAATERSMTIWRRRIDNPSKDFRIGLVWAGKEHPYPNRSCPPSYLEPLVALKGLRFYSLQIGHKDRFPLPKTFTDNLTDLTEHINNFADTAGLIANLDLVITIDTAVAHLAGSMGKPVWVMLPFASDWRWQIERSDSVWYPTMRLFRQPADGDWHSVVAKIVLALKGQLLQAANGLADLESMDIQTCYELGVKLKESGDLAGSEQCFQRVVDKSPELPDPHFALGVVLQLQGRTQESIKYYQAATSLDPLFAKGHYNLANALSLCGFFQEAVFSVRLAIQCNPDYADAHWLFGMLLLRQGDCSDGWREYEWRWKSKRFTSKIPELGRPLWDGSPLEGRTILIHMEQGRGDMIQFVRYAPLVAATGGRVIVCVVPELVTLLSKVTGVSLAVDRNGPLPDFDVHIPVLSLPFLFKTNFDSIPNEVPYIFQNHIKIKEWRDIVSTNTNLRIALTWAGQEYPDPTRAIPFTDCLPLFSVQGIDIFSLQLGKAAEILESLPNGCKIVDHTRRISDFADTAALMSNLDLVISVDTAVAHLAGALGKTVWLLLPFVSDWRWQTDRSDSVWYPTMKIFRQKTSGDWPGVIAMVKEELTSLSTGGESYNQQGIKLLQQGLADKAELCFLNAIRIAANRAESFCNLGVSLDAQYKYEEAIDNYRKAINLRPNYMQAFFNMGNSYRASGNSVAAVSCYEQVLTLTPDFLPALLSLGEIFKELQRYDQAEEYFATSIRTEPQNVFAWRGLGDSLHGQEHFTQAIQAYRQALAIDSTKVSTYNMMGLSYHHSDQPAQAEACFRKALTLTPNDPALLNNLGTLLHSQERTDEAISVYRQLLNLDPNYAEGHWNLSLALLANGEFSEGWQEYEWRSKKNIPVTARTFSCPRWDGSPLNGKTILLHCEQGFGDTIQFARYVPMVTQQGCKVILECQSLALKSLLKSLDGVEIVVSGDKLPSFDYYLPLLSLPLIFNTTISSIPVHIPYLAANNDDIKIWQQRLAKTTKFRIGLAWFGRQNIILNRKRSCQLETFAPLVSLPNTEFYSLQVGEGSEQYSCCSFSDNLLDYSGGFHDFADTAAFIMNLDLVITIDSAVAHLAGSLGIPTWTILPFGADWRWLQKRHDSPWYPTMRLFRQPAIGDWQSVVNSLQESLLSTLNSHTNKES